MKNIFFAVCWLLCGCITAAQPSANRIEIGDDVSQLVFHRMLRYPQQQLQISDFRGKLVILDFWSTWCSSCYKGFLPALDLQEKFRNQVKIISVNCFERDDSAAIEKAIGKWEKGANAVFRFPIARFDSAALYRLMPNGVPHFMWIDQAGIFRASTRDDGFTEAGILAALKGDFSAMRQTSRTFSDINSLLAKTPGFSDDSVNYLSMLSCRVYDFSGGSGPQYDTSGNIRGLFSANATISGLYRITDSVLTFFPENRIKVYGLDNTTRFSYQLWWKGKSLRQLQQTARDELNRLLQASAGWQLREIDCWVLSVTDPKKLPLSKARYSDNNTNDPMPAAWMFTGDDGSNVVAYLNDYSAIPVVDETNNRKPLDLSIPNPYTLEQIAKLFPRYGLSLVKTKRRLPVFVIEPK